MAKGLEGTSATADFGRHCFVLFTAWVCAGSGDNFCADQRLRSTADGVGKHWRHRGMAPPLGDDEGRKGWLRRLSGDEDRDGDWRGGDGWSSGADPGIGNRDPDDRLEYSRGLDREVGGADVECLHHHAGGGGGERSAGGISVPGFADFSAGDRIFPCVFDSLFCGAVSGLSGSVVSGAARAGWSKSSSAVRAAPLTPRSLPHRMKGPPMDFFAT